MFGTELLTLDCFEFERKKSVPSEEVRHALSQIAEPALAGAHQELIISTSYIADLRALTNLLEWQCSTNLELT